MTLGMKCKQICFLLLPLLIPQVSVAQTPQQTTIAPPQLPDNLKVPANQVLLLGQRATGVQIYQCKAKSSNANQFEWTFVAPEAKLFDAQGKNNIQHYAGPTWVGQTLDKNGQPLYFGGQKSTRFTQELGYGRQNTPRS